MINTSEILQTVRMISEEKLDVRTITMGISLYECAHPDKKVRYTRFYDRITRLAAQLVRTGKEANALLRQLADQNLHAASLPVSLGKGSGVIATNASCAFSANRCRLYKPVR